MQYRKLGQTGLKVSILGFGCMRLPTLQPGISDIDQSKSIKLIRKAIDGGVNYVDSAFLYHGGNSEIVLGKSLQNGYREKVYVETKLLLSEVNRTEDYDKLLKIQSEKLGVNKIDVYLFHSISWKRYQDKVVKLNLIEQAKLAKKEGRIGHIGFSSHDTPDNIKKLIDTGNFEVMLVQYNILDQQNRDVITYAGEKGLGVNIMGPNAGGRLAFPQKGHQKSLLTTNRNNFVDTALDFVWSHPNVSVALSGMNSLEMVEDNIQLASKPHPPLSEIKLKRINEIYNLFKAGSDIPCTGCAYCLPCPEEVNIPFIFSQLFQTSTDAISWEYAKQFYNYLGKSEEQLKSENPNENWEDIKLNPESPGNNALSCIECGVCEEKCPQNIPIREKLVYAHDILTKYVSYNM